jgi:hypothetical protein
VPINSSIRFHDAQNNLNDILFTHVKFYRQWLLRMNEKFPFLPFFLLLNWAAQTS